jgi:protein phosphatase
MISKDQARFSQNKNLVTRAVGIDPEVETEVHTYPVEPGDIYLLCSDGLSDMLLADEISEILARHQSSLEEVCNVLIERSNDSGGRDNISVILIRVGSSNRKAGSLLDRFLSWAA